MAPLVRDIEEWQPWDPAEGYTYAAFPNQYVWLRLRSGREYLSEPGDMRAWKHTGAGDDITAWRPRLSAARLREIHAPRLAAERAARKAGKLI